MNDHEQELLEKVREQKQKLEPEQFRSWLRGFLEAGRNTDRFTEEVEKIKES